MSRYHCCEEMALHVAEGEVAITYNPEFREYHILVIRNGQVANPRQKIAYCPWCGTRLPNSLSNEWFERIWSLGLDPSDPHVQIPKEMKSDAWWRSEGL